MIGQGRLHKLSTSSVLTCSSSETPHKPSDLGRTANICSAAAATVISADQGSSWCACGKSQHHHSLTCCQTSGHDTWAGVPITVNRAAEPLTCLTVTTVVPSTHQGQHHCRCGCASTHPAVTASTRQYNTALKPDADGAQPHCRQSSFSSKAQGTSAGSWGCAKLALVPTGSLRCTLTKTHHTAQP